MVVWPTGKLRWPPGKAPLLLSAPGLTAPDPCLQLGQAEIAQAPGRAAPSQDGLWSRCVEPRSLLQLLCYLPIGAPKWPSTLDPSHHLVGGQCAAGQCRLAPG